MNRIWKYKKRFQLFYLSISTVCTIMIIVSDCESHFKSYFQILFSG